LLVQSQINFQDGKVSVNITTDDQLEYSVHPESDYCLDYKENEVVLLLCVDYTPASDEVKRVKQFYPYCELHFPRQESFLLSNHIQLCSRLFLFFS
jgi:hypothetical protein